MSIQVACPSCGARFAGQNALAGKRVRCPKCQGVIDVPAAAKAESPQPKPQSPPTSPSPAPQPPAQPAAADGIGDLLDEWEQAGAAGAEAPDDYKLASARADRCPMCSAAMQGHEILCVQCGYNRQSGKKLQTKRDAAKPPPEEEWSAGIPRGSGRQGSQPPWEREMSFDALLETTTEVINHPRGTFENLVLHGSWWAPCCYAAASYIVFSLVMAVIYMVMGFLASGGEGLDNVDLTRHAGGLAIALAMLMGISIFVIFCVLLFRAVVTYVLILATGNHRGNFETTLKVIGYVEGAVIWLALIPVVGSLTAFVLWLTHTVVGLKYAHNISYPRAIGVFLLSFFLSCALGAFTLNLLGAMLSALLPV